MELRRAASQPLSIRGRLVKSLLWISITFGLLTSVVVWYVIAHEMGELMDQELREAAEIFHSVMAVQPDLATDGQSATHHFGYEEHLVWQVVDASSGRVRSRSHKAPEQALQGAPTDAVVWTQDGQWRAFTSVFSQRPEQFLVVAQSRKERDEVHGEVVWYTLVAALSMGLLSALLMNWRIRQELRPLAALGHGVQHYDPLRPDTAPTATPRQELLPIEHAIGDLGHRLAQRIISERAFTAHAAHALRTPVAGIDVQLALAVQEAPASIRPRLVRARDAAGRLGRVMQALLVMFRSGLEPQRQAVDLRQIMDALAFHDMAISLRQTAPVTADPDLLAAALLNLLDNSHRFHAHQVTITALQEGKDTVLRVQDDGVGCSPQTQARLQQSLQQQAYGEGSAMGGLGLVLADLVARAHGGHAALPDSAMGFTVELRWPADLSASAA